MSDIQDDLVRATDTLRDALSRLQTTSRGVVLLVGASGRLTRTVTDGDIRRLLLSGADLSTPLESLPPQAPVIGDEACSAAQALALMTERKIHQLPIVDAAGKPVKLLLRRDLDTQILLSTPHLGTNELAYVEEAFRTNWIAPLGPNVDAFEREIAQYLGVRDAAALSSGTAGIHLALRLLGVGAGDEVFCSTLTFVASANPILYEQATPVFIDSDPASWNLSVTALEAALHDAKRRGRVPKALIVVNLYGQSADMDPILELCGAYGVPVIEDAAESLGATYKGSASGTFGRIGVFSFNGNKIITTSGGGMIVSDDPALVSRARFLSTQAREPQGHYEHVEVGYNYRMSNVLAGIGRGQLQVLEERVAARRRVFDYYRQRLAGLDRIEWMPEAPYGHCTRWLTAATLQPGVSVPEVIELLKAERIEARRVWKPMHLQPLFEGRRYFTHDPRLDVAADLFERGICLPSGSNMADEQLERVADALQRLLSTR